MSFHGIWPGVVVDNKYPEPGRGLIKVRVPQIFGGEGSLEKIAEEDLPWARPCMPTVGKNSGALALPEIGAGVWIMFVGGDPSLPVWMGGWYGAADKLAEHLSPDNIIFKTPNGCKMTLRDRPNSEAAIEESSGQRLKFQPGLSELTCLGQHTETVTGEKITTVSGNGTTTVAGDKTVTAGMLNFTSAGNVSLTSGLLMTLTATALLTISALAGLTLTTVGVLSLAGGAAVTITAVGTFKLLSTAVVLGQESSAQKLLNRNMMDLFNSHTHKYNPGPGSPVSSFPPEQPAIEDTHTTVNVKAS